MFTVSEDAQKLIASFFESNPDEGRTLRVYVAPGGCNGPQLGLSVDQADPSDVCEKVGDITFCMDEKLMEQTGGVAINADAEGLFIKAARTLPAFEGGSGCSCCGGGCCS